ncbi:MAG: RNA polymerase sigma factor [Bacteroidaceae bacterium]|nr:RNA polymerase sigma factor [Bacteroidaceae bacterium]
MENISFRTAVLPLGDRLFRLALRITMNRAEAEDVVQDTLLKVWEQRSQWEQINNLEAFALTICRNRALDVIKRAGRNTASLDKVDNGQWSMVNGQSTLEAREQISLVRRLMDGLPEVQRTIMQLRDIEGMTYQEIAQLLDISETQVKVYLHRARTKIRKGLEIRD